MRVCSPDIKTPFQSLEDAVSRSASRQSLLLSFSDVASDLDLEVVKLPNTRVCDLREVVEIRGYEWIRRFLGF
uniref:Uncharacterized protein n=1 Tax=Arundo donax TaxID=35708 RepID=A0A0A9HRN5_ARUDO